MSIKRGAVFVAVSLATYFLLVFAGLLLGGGAVSCQSACTDTQRWMNDAYPAPMILGIAVALAAGAVVAGRVTR